MTAHSFEVGSAPAVVTKPPGQNEYLSDRFFRGLAWISAAALVGLVAYILWEIGYHAFPAIRANGVSFLYGMTWDPPRNVFGILPAIWGTLYSSLLALAIGGFFGITVAIFLTQDFLPARLAMVFRTIIEMLAAIPSVVFGLWGIYVVIPAIRPIADVLHTYLGWIPFFGTTLSGPGLLPAALVLSIMVLPTVAAISQDALQLVPFRTKEAAFGMGATRWEAILQVMVPTAAGGIFSALVLGFGRALGETMALAMLIGNNNQVSLSMFAPANTLASLLASNFPEAGQVERQALLYAALVLLAITLGVNIVGTAMLNFTTRRMTGKA